MPDYQLHADYDRDGRLSASSGEYGQRAQEPGAVVVPNLDADSRRLPDEVSAGPAVTLDRDRPVKLGNDDENLPLRIRTVKDSAPADAQFFLRLVGRQRINIELHDQRGIILQHPAGVQQEIPFTRPPVGKDLNVTIEVQALAGTTEGRSDLLGTHFEPDTEDEAAFSIELRSRTPDGAETLHDTAFFTIAAAVVLDNAAPAERVYIAPLLGNEGSIAEVAEALDGTGVDLVEVPGDVSAGDTWLQDQFQHALVEGADGYRQVLIHLPRMHNRNALSGDVATNLEGFVNGHFPSRDVGVFDQLWKREFVFKDAAGKAQRLSFRASHATANAMQLAVNLWFVLASRIRRLDSTWSPDAAPGWSDKLLALEDLRRTMRQKVKTTKQRFDKWEIEALAKRVDRVLELQVIDEKKANQKKPNIYLRRDHADDEKDVNKRWFLVDADTADQIYLRISQAHSSHNYGGNIEASPPVPDAPLGKLLIGQVAFKDADLVDPDLFRLFAKQNKQPIVTIDTGWLDVGHVDEVVGFAPDNGQRQPGFAILRASSSLALRLLELARDRYVAGLPADHPHHNDPGPDDPSRLTVDGSSPVTRLFRGKLWHQKHADTPGGLPTIFEPPTMYYGLHALGLKELPYVPAPPRPRAYLADATVRELVFCEVNARGESTNSFIEAFLLSPMVDTLKKAFPDPRMFAVPVLFDREELIDDWDKDSRTAGTSAFTPAVVNFQVVAGRLLVPRPYGPRMKVDDARAVLKQVFDEQGFAPRMITRLTTSFIKAHKLGTGVYWLEPADLTIIDADRVSQDPPVRNLLTDADVIEQFRDSFPGASDKDLRDKIIKPNRKNFDATGAIRDEGVQKYLIDDGMLDLFETYMQLIAAELDVPIFWIDTWHYHVLLGGIHCGTNVLRKKPRAGVPKTWTVKGVQPLVRATADDERG